MISAFSSVYGIGPSAAVRMFSMVAVQLVLESLRPDRADMLALAAALGCVRSVGGVVGVAGAGVERARTVRRRR